MGDEDEDQINPAKSATVSPHPDSSKRNRYGNGRIGLPRLPMPTPPHSDLSPPTPIPGFPFTSRVHTGKEDPLARVPSAALDSLASTDGAIVEAAARLSESACKRI